MRVSVGVVAAALILGSGSASAQFGGGFSITDGSAFALVGCEVAGSGDPSVRFAQLSDGIRLNGSIGRNDLEGRDCANVLSALIDAGMRISSSNPVQRNANREIIVYDLIRDTR